MNKRQKSKLNMYEAIIQLCQGNLTLIATINALNIIYGGYKANVAAIVSAGGLLEAVTSGVTESKQDSLERLSKLGSLVAAAVSAFAAVNENKTLQKEMDISEAKIKNAPGMVPAEICQLIYDRAMIDPAGLLDYGITGLILSTLLNSIEDFTNQEPKPKLSIDEKKALREELKGMFKDVDETLETKMDKLMKNFEESEPVFVGTYRALRKPVKPSVAHTVVKVQILNVLNDKPIRNVRVYHDEAKTPKRSSEKGFVTYKNPAEGGHSLVLKHKLFKDKTVTGIVVVHGEKQTLVLKMEGV